MEDEGKVRKYLEGEVMEVWVGEFVGAVPMYRIVASRGEIITTGIYDRKNKKDILKGHFSIKMKPIQNQRQQ
jgi:hypothetical protein